MAESVVAELVDLLRLERLEDNLFRGQSRDIGTKYVFGGQVLGQALAAELPSLRFIAGHEELDTEQVAASDDPALRVPRKRDPGPLFPWAEVLAAVPLRRLESPTP